MLDEADLQEASPRAIGLASEIVQAVRARRAQDKHLTWYDFLQSLVLARRELAREFGAPEARVRRLILVGLVALLVAVSAFVVASQN